MKIKIKNIEFENWRKANGYNNVSGAELVEKYFNEVLRMGVLKSMIVTIREAENSEEYDSGILVSTIIENYIIKNSTVQKNKKSL